MLLDIYEGGGGSWELFVPTIGNYFLSQQQLSRIIEKRFETVIIADMAFPKVQLEAVRDGCKRLIIFDHHIQDIVEKVQHINPVARGTEPAKVPSNTWNIRVHHKLPVNVLTVLGLLGDNEERIIENKFVWPEMKGFLDDAGIPFNLLSECVDLIDSNYQVGDSKGVRDAVAFLREHGSSPESILERTDWMENVDRVDFETEKWLNTPAVELGESLVLKRIRTKCHIASSIGRKTARALGKMTIVHNKADTGELEQLYIRGVHPLTDMSGLIDDARRRGFFAGGKRDVMGVLLPTKDLESYMEQVINKLKDMNKGLKA